MKEMKIVVPGDPIGKPRMTRRDKWKQRDCVMRYRSWADLARLMVIQTGQRLPAPEKIMSLSWVAYIEMPGSWSEKKKVAMQHQLHRSKPDIDNILKSSMDALFENDAAIASVAVMKVWTRANPRMEITIKYQG